MRRPILTVYAKELRDALRDRRTALMIFFGSIFAGPLMLVLMAQFISGLEQKAADLRVRVAGQERAPELVNFLQRNDVQIDAAPPDYEARVRDGSIDAVIVIPENFQDRFAAGDSAKVELVYDDSRKEAAPAINQAERLLRAFNHETGTLRMIARGVSPDLVQPLKLERVNTATARQRGALILFFIPMLLILAALTGGMTVAIDSTAGERERGSLEPLLLNPVPAHDLVMGKWLAAWTFASSVAVLTLAGFVVASLAYAQKKIPALMAFGVHELALFVALIVPFAALTSSLSMLICTYGRSYREAQTYVSYLITVIALLPAVVLFTGLKDEPWQLAVPFLGQLMVMGRVMRGDAIAVSDGLAPACIAFVLAAVCIALLARLLRDERIVFGRT